MKIIMWILGFLVLSIIARVVRQFAGAMVTPPRIHLKSASPNGDHAQHVEEKASQLEACGFRRIGCYRVEPMKGVLLTAFGHAEQSLCAIVYTHPIAGSWVDVVSKSESDNSLTVTTAIMGEELDQRPGHQKIYDCELSVRSMYELALQKRPQGPYQTWKPGNFVSKFEKAYADEMDWRAGRGGVTEDEVRRHANATGREFSDEEIREATDTLQRQYAESRREMR